MSNRDHRVRRESAKQRRDRSRATGRAHQQPARVPVVKPRVQDTRVAHMEDLVRDAWQPSIGADGKQVAFNDAQPIGRIPLQQAIQQRRAVVARFHWNVAEIQQSRRQLFQAVHVAHPLDRLADALFERDGRLVTQFAARLGAVHLLGAGRQHLVAGNFDKLLALLRLAG